jgi:hypothetical protein
MFRILPKLLLSATRAPGRPIIVPAWSGWMRNILRLARPDAAVVEQNPSLSYDLEDLLVPLLPAPEAHLPPVLQACWASSPHACRPPRHAGTYSFVPPQASRQSAAHAGAGKRKPRWWKGWRFEGLASPSTSRDDAYVARTSF